MTIKLNELTIKLNANQLANKLDKIWDNECRSPVISKSADILKQQAKEIEQLTIANQDLKYQLIKKAGEQVLDDFSKDMLLQQAKEIEQLKADLEDCTCQIGHSAAYLKVKEMK